MISFPDLHTSDSVDIWGGVSRGFENFAMGMVFLTVWLASRIARIQFTNPDAHPLSASERTPPGHDATRDGQSRSVPWPTANRGGISTPTGSPRRVLATVFRCRRRVCRWCRRRCQQRVRLADRVGSLDTGIDVRVFDRHGDRQPR